MLEAAAAAERMRDEAALWAVTLADEAVDDATRAACAEWCARDERHARLLAEMRQMWEAVTPDTPGTSPVTVPARRRVSRKVQGVLALVLAPCLLVAAGLLPWDAWLADERSGTGEIRHFSLADGSRVALNSDSAIDVDLTGSVRRLQLLRGEVFVEVAPGSKPFAVVDRDGAVNALGTRYAVRREDNDTLVTVTESRVRVQPLDGGDHWVEVQAGQQVRFDRHGVTTDNLPAAPNGQAWQSGRLVFDDVPVADVLRQLARYRRGLLLADDAALGDLRFTGVVPIAQSDEALALLASALPLKVSTLSPWLVRVTARDNAGAR